MFSNIDLNADHKLQPGEYVSAAKGVIEREYLAVVAGEIPKERFAEQFGHMTMQWVLRNHESARQLGASYFTQGAEKLDQKSIDLIISEGEKLNKLITIANPTLLEQTQAAAKLAFKRAQLAVSCLR